MNKSYFIAVFIFVLFRVSYSQTFLWVKTNTHPISFSSDYAQFPSAVDVSGSFTIGTIFNFKLTYGTSFYGDVIFRKYNPSGSEIMNKVLSGKADIKSIDTDASGNIYLRGTFMDTLKIDSLNLIFNTGSGLNINDYLIKFSSTGTVIWKKNITSIYGSNAQITASKVKSNFLLAGIFIPGSQGYIKKFDLNGNELSSSSINPIRTISGLDADQSGNIFAAGSCAQGNVQFSGLNVNCPYIYSMYFAKLNQSGTGLWAKMVEDVTFENPAIVCDNSGNAFACGDLNSPTMFGTLQAMGPQWVYDFYLTKIDASGTFMWVKEVPNPGGTPTGDAGVGKMANLKVDAQNNAYITGFQRGTINWGNFTTTSAGAHDLLVMKFNSNGNLLWGKTAGSTFGERGDAISLDNSNNIYISGNFNQSSLFDTIAVTGSGLINSFSAKLSNPPVTGITNNSTPLSYFLTSYPNPFNPSAKIVYTLANTGNVNISIYDITGKKISELVNQIHSSGNYEIQWDGTDYTSGIYFCRIETKTYTNTIKMMLLK